MRGCRDGGIDGVLVRKAVCGRLDRCYADRGLRSGCVPVNGRIPAGIRSRGADSAVRPIGRKASGDRKRQKHLKGNGIGVNSSIRERSNLS